MPIVVIADGYGGPEHLRVVEEELASPGPGQVLLDVRAAGVNPADVKSYNGAFGTDPARLPLRLGSEAAGVVAEVGPQAIGPAGPLRPGDEVIAYRISGGYASQALVPAAALLPKPAGMSWPQAAGLMLAGATAVHALTVMHPEPGEAVLVHGAAGAVGLIAVQLAVTQGVRVIGTASAGSHDLLRLLGAEPVTYGDGLAGRVRDLAPGGVAAALDTAGTDEAVDVSVELVPDRTRVVTVAGFARGAEQGIVRIGGGPGADPGVGIRERARLQLTQAVTDGVLRVLVAGTFPLSQAAEAHRAVLGRHRPGKFALLP